MYDYILKLIYFNYNYQFSDIHPCFTNNTDLNENHNLKDTKYDYIRLKSDNFIGYS